MTYGAKLFTEAGQLAYSTDYPVYQFVGKFTLNSLLPEVNIISSHTPLVFVKPYNNGSSTECVSYIMFLKTTNPNTWTIQATTSAGYTINKVNSSFGGYPNQYYVNNNLPVEVLIFVRPSNTDAATGYGMNVYDASGNLSFTSTMKPLKVAAYHDTTAQSGTPYLNADPYWIPESLTGGSIPTNWACCVSDLGIARKSTVSPSYYNSNGNQGMIWERVGAGKGSDSVTVNFDEAGWFGTVPPGVGGQYPNYSKIGGRRILFVDHSNYTTPAYDNTNWAPILSGSSTIIPYNGSSIKLAGATYAYNSSPSPTSVVVYSNPSSGSVSVTGALMRYTAQSGTIGPVYGLTFRGFYNNRASGLMSHEFYIGDPSINISNSATLPSGTLGSPYAVTLNGTGGATLPYVFYAQQDWVSNGYPFPPGLTLDTNTGVISGTPTQRGTYQILITINDSTWTSGLAGGLPYYYNAKLFTITIN